MKTRKFFSLLVLTSALLLPACNSVAESILDDVKSYAQTSDSQPGGASSQNTPTQSSNNNDHSSSNVQPSSNNQGGESNNSQPNGGTLSRYEISEADWNALITQYGIFGANSNITLTQEIKLGSATFESGVLEVNYGDVHMKNDSVGEETFELYLDLLADGSINFYDINEETGKWEMNNLPASYSQMAMMSFVTFIPPFAYSELTYNSSLHAYTMASGTINVGEGQTLAISNVVMKFEDNKFMSLTYDILSEGVTSNASVIASKWGATSFTFPTIDSQGHGEIPDDNPFVNKAFVYKDIKEFAMYSDKVTEDYVKGCLSTAQLSLFSDGEFEMHYKDAAGLRSVVLGTYSATKESAELVTRSLFSDKAEGYSFNIPAYYERFTVLYYASTNTFEMGTYFVDDNGTLIAKMTIVFVEGDAQPVRLNLPREPINDKWSVTKEVWNNFFDGQFINRQSNLTINHSDNVLAFDNGKVYSKVSYAQYGGSGFSEIYLQLLNDQLNKVDYYEYDASNQIWTVRSNVDYAFMIMVGSDLGVKAYDFNQATYNEFGHYYAIREFSEFPYGQEAGYEVKYTDIKIYFENNQLQKITYKPDESYGQTETFLYDKFGSTVVTLPEIGPAPILEDMFVNKAYKYDSYTSSNSAFNIAQYAGSLANDEMRFFHDTTDYTFEWLMDNRYYDGVNGNSIVLCGKYSVRKASYSGLEYQYYLSLNVKNVYVNGMALDEQEDSGLFETITVYYFEADNKMCFREDGVSFMQADGTYDYTNIRLYFKSVGDNSWHFDLPRLEDNWIPYDVIMAMSQIGVMNDNLPKMDYVKRFVISTVDTTNKAFDITCEMPNKFFVDHVFKPYKESLRTKYNYKAEYNTSGEISAVVSPNGEFKITFEVQEDWIVIFHVQEYTSTIPQAEYPTRDIQSYLTENNITDVVPEFKVNGATQYMASASDGSLYLIIMVDASLIDNAVNALIRLLSQAEYVPSAIGDMTVYSSKNNQLSIFISPYKESNMIGVAFLKPMSSTVLTSYPTDKLSEYLRGVRDAVPSFDHEDGETYASYGATETNPRLDITVYLKSDTSASVTQIVKGFETDLVENKGYEKLILNSESAALNGEEFYVSPNKQVAISFMYSELDKAYNVEFINLTLYTDVEFLHSDSPTALSVFDYQSEFEVGDEFTLGEEASAYVYLYDGTELEISVENLTYKPVTFTESGEYEIEVSYTVNGVTVTDTIYVWVNEDEPDYEDYIIIIDNFTDIEGLEDASVYAVVKGSSIDPDGDYCYVEINVDENNFIVYTVNTSASEMTIFVEGEDGEVAYYAFVRLVEGQTTYTVTLLSPAGVVIED